MIGVSGAAVSQYERGDQTPSPQTLRAIVDRLNLPVSYFFRPVADHRGGPVFCRSMASATKSARTRAIRRYEWLREI
ncbi:MAG: helix-turn-helix domain-containing protein, partial [Planctomycetota bacterium]|nr:helix-turn-helix domain-containing protein [Planctomycetota bacterium]